MALYLFGKTEEEWDRIPWYRQRGYIEEYHEWQREHSESGGESQGPSTDLSGAAMGEFAALGFREHNL